MDPRGLIQNSNRAHSGIMLPYYSLYLCLQEYPTRLGMTNVVLRGSWGCHHCKTDMGPPWNDTQNDTLRKVCPRCRHCKIDRGPSYLRMSLRRVPFFFCVSCGQMKTLGIQSPCQMMIGVYNHLLSKVFRFHYHSQKVIGSLGKKPWKVCNRSFSGLNEVEQQSQNSLRCGDI